MRPQYPPAIPACQRIELAGLNRWRERSACNPIPSAINGSGVSYVLKLHLYLFVAGVVGFLVARWLSPLGLFVNLICAFPAAYLTILIGRRIFNKPGGL
jgi:hypothetical protein